MGKNTSLPEFATSRYNFIKSHKLYATSYHNRFFIGASCLIRTEEQAGIKRGIAACCFFLV
jgi:hypothetical protein